MHSAPHLNRWSHAKALWAIFWRMLLLTPFVAIFGTLALVAVLALSIFPPFLAVVLVIGADYLWAVATVAVWLVGLRYTIQVSSDLFNWTSLTNVIANASGVGEFSDTAPLGPSQRFYRALQP